MWGKVILWFEGLKFKELGRNCMIVERNLFIQTTICNVPEQMRVETVALPHTRPFTEFLRIKVNSLPKRGRAVAFR